MSNFLRLLTLFSTFLQSFRFLPEKGHRCKNLFPNFLRTYNRSIWKIRNHSHRLVFVDRCVRKEIRRKYGAPFQRILCGFTEDLGGEKKGSTKLETAPVGANQHLIWESPEVRQELGQYFMAAAICGQAEYNCWRVKETKLGLRLMLKVCIAVDSESSVNQIARPLSISRRFFPKESRCSFIFRLLIPEKKLIAET